MTSIDYNKMINFPVQSANISTSEVIPSNNDRNPNTSTIANVDEETVVSSDAFAYNPALYSFCKEKSIVKILKVGDTGILEFQNKIRNGVFGVTLWPQSADSDYDNLFDKIFAAVPEAALWSNRRPNIGDLLFGRKMNGGWVRGYVITVLPQLRIAVMDEARVVTVNELATCEEPISDFNAFSGICELSDTTQKFMEDDDGFDFKVTGQTDNEEQDKFEILLLRGDLELKATVKPWIPMPEQLGIPFAQLNNGTEVCITSYRNHMSMYVRPVDTLGLERHNYIMQAVAKCAETSPFFDGQPRVGVRVLAQSADGNYYRACVTCSEHNGRVRVLYDDLGYREYVDTKKIKILPFYLKTMGYNISRVRLRDVPKDIPPVQSIIDILDNLVENKVTLLCTFNCIPTTEGVYLKFPNGGSVNNMIRECLNLEPTEAAK